MIGIEPILGLDMSSRPWYTPTMSQIDTDLQSVEPLFSVVDSRGIRHVWLAEQLGIDRRRWWEMRKGQRRFPDDLRSRAAELLGVPESVLFRPSEAAMKESA